METQHAWVGAGEPLAPVVRRPEVFHRFVREATSRGRSSCIMPVGQDLADKLKSLGYSCLPIGAEPIFQLEEYFRTNNPIERFPSARALLRKGARVYEVKAAELEPPLRTQMETLIENWRKSRRTVPLDFLNQVEPWLLQEEKKFFILELFGRIEAFLAAVPIYASNGYFFADYIRSVKARAGTIELLFAEAFRILKDQGCSEVRLGLCPLARLDQVRGGSLRQVIPIALLRLWFSLGRFPYSFKSIYAFKAKFQPTSWEPLYLVSSKRLGFSLLRNVVEVHFPGGIQKALSVSLTQAMTSVFRLKRPLPESMAQLASKAAFTLGLSWAFFFLHLFRENLALGKQLFSLSGFSPANPTLLGLALCPVFHNNAYHLAGDALSFLIFGALLEGVFSRGLWVVCLIAGFWVSNLLTWGLVTAFLPTISLSEYLRFSAEIDYGSSNAVYSFVGALAALSVDRRWLMIPFFANGLFLCFARQSWLSLHHLLALFLGFALGAWWLRRQGSTEDRSFQNFV